MKFSAVVLFAAGAFAAANDWNAIARAVTPVQQISDGQVQNPATPVPSYPAGNGTVVAPTGTAGPTGAGPTGGAAGPTGGSPTTSGGPAQVSTNAADALKLPVVGAGLAGVVAMLAL